jgi:hypothetical protein
VEKNKYQLTKYELLRTENILKRAIDVEAGVSEKPRVTEEHPDGCEYLILCYLCLMIDSNKFS